MQRSLSALALPTWATARRAVRPASLAASAPAAVLDASSLQASARAARPLASGAPPELLVAGVESSVVPGRGSCWPRSFHSPSQGVVRRPRRASWASASPICSTSPLPHSVPSVSALAAYQSTVLFGSAVPLGVVSPASVQPAGTIEPIFAHPGALPNPAINRTASGSRLSPRSGCRKT